MKIFAAWLLGVLQGKCCWTLNCGEDLTFKDAGGLLDGRGDGDGWEGILWDGWGVVRGRCWRKLCVVVNFSQMCPTCGLLGDLVDGEVEWMCG